MSFELMPFGKVSDGFENLRQISRKIFIGNFLQMVHWWPNLLIIIAKFFVKRLTPESDEWLLDTSGTVAEWHCPDNIPKSTTYLHFEEI